MDTKSYDNGEVIVHADVPMAEVITEDIVNTPATEVITEDVVNTLTITPATVPTVKSVSTVNTPATMDTPVTTSKPTLIHKIRAVILSWLIYFTLRAHDAWIHICDSAWEFYCKFLCTIAREITRQPKLLYAYLDPIPKDARAQTQVRIVTSALHAYYMANSLLSCFTMQEWLKRFNISTDHVNLVFIRGTEIVYSRLDLTNDIETITGDGADTDLSTVPGKTVHNIDVFKSHAE